MVYEKDKKKVIIEVTIAVAFLLLLIVGATYGFFSFTTGSSKSKTDVYVRSEAASLVSLTGGTKNLHIIVDGDDMSSENVGKNFYATDSKEKNYLTEDEDHTFTLAEINVDGVLSETNNCTADLEVAINGNLKAVLQEDDTLLHVEGINNDLDIDLATMKDESPKTYTLEFTITKDIVNSITGYLKLTNRSADQTDLAEKQLEVNLTTKNLKCGVFKTVEEKILASDQLEPEQQMTERGDTLRRYQGQVENDGQGNITNDVNNYICFETSDKEECKSNTDKYMYRIIGVDTTNKEIKVIKREALNISQTWTSGSGTWADSTLQKNLNGNLYLSDVSKNWSNIIIPHDWGYGDVYFDASTTSLQAYQNEQNAIKSGSNRGVLSQTQVSLMYASDYWLSGGVSLKCCNNSSSDRAECKKSWLHLSNNDTANLSTTKQAPPREFEWTMLLLGSGGLAWLVNPNGEVGTTPSGDNLSVRPVFYLSSEIKIIDGDGSRENPYIIEEPHLPTAEEKILASTQLESEQQMKDRGDTLRRYQGKVETNGATITSDVNNYICFETSNKETCTGDTDKYLYRIIGIDTTNKEIKVMKREALDAVQVWGSNGQTWETINLQQALNTTLYLNNVSKDWADLILSHNWKYGDIASDSTGFGSFDENNTNVGADAYKIEQEKLTSILTNTKIGLIYPSDYWLSGGPSLYCRKNSATNGFVLCKKGWMFIDNNDSASLSTSKLVPYNVEWTMSRVSDIQAWVINDVGNVTNGDFNHTNSVRPVFYLESGIKLSGIGTLINPYIIENVEEN